jgi:hypothetical protein
MEHEPAVDPAPGCLLRWIAERVASRATCERVLFPLLADLQFEHSEARRPWARAFVRARGVLARRHRSLAQAAYRLKRRNSSVRTRLTMMQVASGK